MLIIKVVLFLLLIYIVMAAFGFVSGQQTDRPYQELGRAAHFELASDGLIIGFEKRSFRKRGGNVLGTFENQPLYSNFVKPISDADPDSPVRNKYFRRYAYWNSKVMIPTQVVSRINGVQEYRYNAYEHSLDGEYSYEESFKELSKTFLELQESVFKSSKYSHILVFNMGWNNDQVESLWRYNTMINNIKKVAEEDGSDFNPFVLAITWPSVWGAINDLSLTRKIFHLLSYPNKTLDADELGITWMNWIINDQIPGLLENNLAVKPKVVLIGHSLGARILTRALFSSDHILSSKGSGVVDLMLGLQPAFSARRFVRNSGMEGSPYTEFKKVDTHLVFTTSKHDLANPIANYVTGASHLGGSKGLSYARKHTINDSNSESERVFRIVDWGEEDQGAAIYDDSVLLVDASNIVVGAEQPKLSAHNDILDVDMAKLIWHFVKNL